MSMQHERRTMLPSLASLMIVGLFGSAAAQTGPNPVDFAGKTILVTLCVGAGGGLDISTRLFLSEATKHLPGQPQMVIEYNTVTFTTANNFIQSGRKDGTHILGCGNTLELGELIGRKDVRYQSTTLKPVLILPNPQAYLIRSDTGFGAPKDLVSLKRPLVYGHLGADLPENIVIIFLSKLMPELRTRFVFGYGGGGEVQLALLNGEIDMAPNNPVRYYSNAVQDEIKGGLLMPAFHVGIAHEGKLMRDPVYSELPNVVEVIQAVKGSFPNRPEMQIFLSMAALQQVGLGWFLPPGTSDAVQATWAKAIEDALTDPAVAQKAKALSPVEPIIGKKGESVVAQAMALPSDVREMVSTVLTTEFNLKLD